jgi:hypothetical protein
VQIETMEGAAMYEQVEGVGFADALEARRAELASAHAAAAGQDVQFPVETLTVELKVGVTKKAGGNAGLTVPFFGIGIGASARYDRETLQIVTLALGGPVDREGRLVKVARASSERKD